MNPLPMEEAVEPSVPREEPAPPPAVAEAKPRPTPPPSVEEHEIWWGAYSGWKMLPSWSVCFILSLVILNSAWMFVPKGSLQITVFTLVGAVWLAQFVRFGYRIFAYNYRLTNRRLFRDTGFFYDDRIRIDLKLIKKIEVRTTPYEAFFAIGNILITTDESLPPIVLKGVRQPRVVATLIDECRKQT